MKAITDSKKSLATKTCRLEEQRSEYRSVFVLVFSVNEPFL